MTAITESRIHWEENEKLIWQNMGKEYSGIGRCGYFVILHVNPVIYLIEKPIKIEFHAGACALCQKNKIGSFIICKDCEMYFYGFECDTVFSPWKDFYNVAVNNNRITLKHGIAAGRMVSVLRMIEIKEQASLGLWLQQCGRALRPDPGKEKAIILDHGLPTEGREMRLNIISVYKLLKNRDEWEYCDGIFPKYIHKVYDVWFFECEYGNCPVFLWSGDNRAYNVPLLLYVFLDILFLRKKPYKNPVNIFNLKTIKRKK